MTLLGEPELLSYSVVGADKTPIERRKKKKKEPNDGQINLKLIGFTVYYSTMSLNARDRVTGARSRKGGA